MSKDFLVGYTGFVGSNIAAKHTFQGVFNSKNISEAYGEEPDVLVYSGVPSEMFLANQNPEADYVLIRDAMKNIKSISPKQIVLISTIAVYPDTQGADEDTVIDLEKLTAYGANRRALEIWVEKNYEQHLIIRLPAIYGINLKKNFIYDYIHFLPALLTVQKFEELAKKEPLLSQYYYLQNNGFYYCRKLEDAEREVLKAKFKLLGFSALNFTDSRSKYQFYNLAHLWDHISIALQYGLNRLNLVTPPVSIQELYQELTGELFLNKLSRQPYDYALQTKHAELFGGSNGYLMTTEEEIEEIKSFIESTR